MIEGGSIPTGGELNIEQSPESRNRRARSLLRNLVQYNNFHRSIKARGYYCMDLYKDNPDTAGSTHEQIALALDTVLKKYFEGHQAPTQKDAQKYQGILDHRCGKEFSEEEIQFLEKYTSDVKSLYDDVKATTVVVGDAEYHFDDGNLGVMKDNEVNAQVYPDLFDGVFCDEPKMLI